MNEVLRVMADAPADVTVVLNAIAKEAAQLCHAPFARVTVVQDGVLHPLAGYALDGTPRAPATNVPLSRTSVQGRALLDRKTLHYADIAPLIDDEFPDARENARVMGFRAVLAVPLLRGDEGLGAMFLYRHEPGLFTPDQVALVETFARQAAIALHNVRQFRATQDALEQQTATSEILRVISSARNRRAAGVRHDRALGARAVPRVLVAGAPPSTQRTAARPRPREHDAARARMHCAPSFRDRQAATTVRRARCSHVAAWSRFPTSSPTPTSPRRRRPWRPASAACSPSRSCATACPSAPSASGAMWRDRSPQSHVELLQTFADQAAHRDRERAPVHRARRAQRRALRIPGATHGNERHPRGDQPVAHRRAAGVRHDRRERAAPVRRHLQRRVPVRRRAHPRRRAAQHLARGRCRIPARLSVQAEPQRDDPARDPHGRDGSHAGHPPRSANMATTTSRQRLDFAACSRCR